MQNRGSLLPALFAGIIAFIITYIVLAILIAIFRATELVEIGNVIDRFDVLLSLLVGLIYGYSRYNGRV